MSNFILRELGFRPDDRVVIIQADTCILKSPITQFCPIGSFGHRSRGAHRTLHRRLLSQAAPYKDQRLRQQDLRARELTEPQRALSADARLQERGVGTPVRQFRRLTIRPPVNGEMQHCTILQKESGK